MSSHNLNLSSSRSHSIFQIELQSEDVESLNQSVIKSKITLIDLAGSEKLKRLSDNPSQKLVKESIDINKSLLALGQVISALSKKSTHIPYRDSKLTKLLKHSLGGNSYTLIIACLTPADAFVDENLNTLYYASRARNIKNSPVVNEDPKDRLIRQLYDQIEKLKQENAYLKQLKLLTEPTPEVQKVINTEVDKTEKREDVYYLIIIIC